LTYAVFGILTAGFPLPKLAFLTTSLAASCAGRFSAPTLANNACDTSFRIQLKHGLKLKFHDRKKLKKINEYTFSQLMVSEMQIEQEAHVRDDYAHCERYFVIKYLSV
jgi:hypothetical protein